MAIQMISVKCPECGSLQHIEGKRNQFFCSYCGAQVILNNENEYVVRTVDEAKVKRTEAEVAKQLKELEMAQERMQHAEEERKHKTRKWVLIWLIVGILIVAGILLATGLLFSLIKEYGILTVIIAFIIIVVILDKLDCL